VLSQGVVGTCSLSVLAACTFAIPYRCKSHLSSFFAILVSSSRADSLGSVCGGCGFVSDSDYVLYLMRLFS
jgi:hypothetical protein